MTIKEALREELDLNDVSDLALDKVLLDHGIEDSSDEYEALAGQRKLIDLCVIDILFKVYSRADITEGDLSVRNASNDKITARLLYLAKKYDMVATLGLADSTPQPPTINNASNKW